MKHKKTSRVGIFVLSLVLAFTMSFGTAFAGENQITLTPAADDVYMAQIIDQLGGGDGLYKKGLNGFEMYENLGYVFMGWRTTGGTWQNQVIGGYIMDKLKEAGYTTTDEDVAAPYGTKPASDKSDATDADYAWEIQYQNNTDPANRKDLGNTWDPEFASLDVALVKADGTPVNDAEADELAEKVGGTWWGFNPTTTTYQKYFAEEFGMDYDTEIAPLETTSAKIAAMHKVLMKSDVDFDSRTSVDDYTYIARDDYADLNKEAKLNKRTRLATNSCFTDPAGTDPSVAQGNDGEFVYVGRISGNNNSEGIPRSEMAGKIILTDSSVSSGFTYARNNGGVGVASKASVESYLCPKDEDGNILEPWYDSSRYAGGSSLANTVAATNAGTPIVEWQFSNRQYDSLKALLKKAADINANAESDADKVKVTGHQVAIGQVYPMTITEDKPGKGQAVAIAEVKGSVHPEKRVMICAHVQEPGCNDNATGVAALLGLATAYKKLVDAGDIPRPKCTITFMWGDEMNMATYWMDGHKTEKADMIASLDMDMTGEDPEKCGGPMRIEKTPDPSALYGYTLDAVPWNEPDDEIPSPLNPYYDENYNSSWGDGFVRLPDSHTLWGAGSVGNLFKRGWYLNDLYMYATSTVIDRHDPDFEVDVCPYEGGSDHSRFLAQQIPSVLTWHFTDYTYHTSTDTLWMASPRELESVAVTTIATAQLICDACDNEAAALDVLKAVKEAAMKRMDAEAINTEHHVVYSNAGLQAASAALNNEKTVLQAWGTWYDEALESIGSLVDEPSAELTEAIAAARAEMAARTTESLAYADAQFAQSIAGETIDKYVASIDVPEEIQDQVDTIVEVAKNAIAKEEDGVAAAAIATKAIQDIEAALAADATAKALELLNYKIDAQDQLMALVKADLPSISAEQALGVIMDGIAAIGAAESKDAVDAAVEETKQALAEAIAEAEAAAAAAEEEAASEAAAAEAEAKAAAEIDAIVSVIEGAAITEDAYTPESVAAVKAAIDEVNAVRAKEDATAAEINKAVAALNDAIKAAASAKKGKTTVFFSDKVIKGTYNGDALVLDPVNDVNVVGSEGAVTFRFYSDAEATTEIKAPVDAGTYYAKAFVEADNEYLAGVSKATEVVIAKAAQKITKVTPAKKNFKAKKLKKAKATFKLKATTKGPGKVTFKKTSGNAKITVSKAGKVTVKKGLKKGTYKLKVKVTKAATDNYKVKTYSKTITIKVK